MTAANDEDVVGIVAVAMERSVIRPPNVNGANAWVSMRVAPNVVSDAGVWTPKKAA